MTIFLLVTGVMLFVVSGLVLVAVQRGWFRRVVLTAFVIFIVMELRTAWAAPIVMFLSDDASYLPLLVVYGAFVSFLFGWLLVSPGHGLAVKYSERPTVQTRPVSYYTAGTRGLACFLVGLGAWYYQGLPPVADGLLRLLVRGDDAGIVANMTSDARFQLTKSNWFGWDYRGQGVVNELSRVGWSFLLGLCVVAYHHWRRGLWLWLLTGFTFAGLVLVTGAGQRGAVVDFILRVGVVLSLLGGLRVRHIVVGVLTGTLLIVAVTLSSSRGVVYLESELSEASKGLAVQLGRRVFFGNGVHDVEVMELIDSGAWKPGMGVLHVEKAISSFPGVRVGTPLGFRLSGVNQSPEGVYSSGTYLGMVYADFGPVGVFPAFVLMGLRITRTIR